MDGAKNDICSALLEAGGGATPEASRNECVVRVFELRRMLESTACQTTVEPIEPPLVLETHRGFLLKEMAWMAADFRVESQPPVFLYFSFLLVAASSYF